MYTVEIAASHCRRSRWDIGSRSDSLLLASCLSSFLRVGCKLSVTAVSFLKISSRPTCSLLLSHFCSDFLLLALHLRSSHAVALLLQSTRKISAKVSGETSATSCDNRDYVPDRPASSGWPHEPYRADFLWPS